jgi:hypothetical protein
LLCSAVLAALFGFGCGSAWAADSLTGSISGTVTDSSGAIIVGATVTLTNTDRGQDVRVLTTGSEGFYTATSLPLGTYTVKVASTGFKTATVTGLQLHAADALTVNKVLVAGSASESITVTAAVEQLNLEDSASSGLITGDQMNELVLNSRNYEQFLQLQPGVVYGGANDQLYVGSTAPSGMSNTVNFAVNGGRSTDNNWTIDGADNLDRGANLTLLTYPSADAIAEVKTLRGQYSAEFGRSASGQVDVVTKSGTNKFHGSAYEFWRNNILNANAWSNKLVAPFTPRPVLRYNDFGESLGGPVWIPRIYNGKDKTFFFFSDETRRLVQYTTGTAFVPTAAERTGDFTNSYTGLTSATGPVSVCTAYNATNGACTAYGDKITITDPVVIAYLKDIYSLIPAPPSAADIAAGQDPHALVSTVPNIYNNNQILARVDQSFGQKLNVFYRYIHDSFPIMAGSGTFAGLTIPGLSATSTKNPGTEHMGHATYLFSPTMLANVGYAYSSNAIYTTPIGAFTTANSKDVNPTLPYQNVLGVIPTLSFTGSNALTGLGSTGIYHDVDQNHNIFGDVTKTLGRHTLIVGASYNHFEKAENSTGGNQGGFTFAGVNTNSGVTPPVTGQSLATQTDLAFANFLIGNANGGFSQASNALTADVLEVSLEAFVQDNFKLSQRLTVNLGVRYGYYAQPTDASKRLSNFNPATFNAANASTIGSTGLICFYSATLCPNTNGYLTTNLYGNANADYQGINYLNGLIFPKGTITGHDSPYGSKVAQADKYNFAPRFGFSYDLFGNGKTALRGGYGWAYNVSSTSFYETAIWTNPPAVTNYGLSTAVLDNPAGTALTIAPSTTPGLIEGTPLNYHTPYTQQFSLDMQQQLSPTFMIDIGYFGTHGTHLLGKINIDEPVPNSYIGKISPTDVSSSCTYSDAAVTSSTPAAYISTTCDRGLNQVRPYLGYVGIDSVQPIFNSNYNALQVKATKKFKGKSMIDANYTWSRNLANAMADYSAGPQNTRNINGDYGRTSDDRNHVLTVDGVYELPWMIDQRGVAGHIVGGWEVSGILAMNSGLPLTITESLGGTVYYGYTNPLNNQANGNEANDSAGIGIAGNTSAGFRPNQIGNPRNGYGQQLRTTSQWFYRGAFAAPLPAALNSGGLGQVGTEHRGVVSAPGFERFDLGLFRNFKIHEGLKFQLRGEAFNLLNHTNLGSPGVASTTSSTFGKITSARDNRILQVAGKFTF